MSFDEFLKSKQEEAQNKPVFDKKERIEQFRKNVEYFYRKLREEWLGRFYEQMSPRFEDVTIHEEMLGDYPIRSLILTIGSDVVRFKPIGTILIGTSGRIDIICNARRGKFILTGEKARNVRAHFRVSVNGEEAPKRDYGKLVWKFVDERGMMSYVDLNADSVQRIIMDFVG